MSTKNGEIHYACGASGAVQNALTIWVNLVTIAGMANFLPSAAVICLIFKKGNPENPGHKSRRHLSKNEKSVVSLGLSGILILVASGAHGGEILGIALGLATLGFASVFLVTSQSRTETEGARGTEMVESWAFGVLLMSICCLYPVLRAGIPRGADLVRIFFLGAVISGIADILYTSAVSGKAKMDMLPATIMVQMSKILAPVWIGLVLGERPSFFSVVGAAILLAAVIWQIVLQAKPNPLPDSTAVD